MKHIYTLCLLLWVSASFAQLYPDRHTTSPSDGWKSCSAADNPNGESGISHWVKFDFETIHSITNIKIWNYNDPANLADGIKTLRIDYSVDNVNWTNAGSFPVTISDGSAFYEGEFIANLNGVSARHVILTAEENHDGACYGFSEIRMYTGQSVPVELMAFEGTCERGKKDINWSFGDVSEFESVNLQWSNNGNDWETIYTSNNAGEKSGEITEASYSDIRQTRTSKNFYRLKMNDINGDSEFSEIIVVSCEVTEQDVQVYPQPVSAEMTINIELLQNSSIVYTVNDVLGQKIIQNAWDGNEGMNQFKLNVENLIPGQYLIRFEIDGKHIEKKFLKN